MICARCKHFNISLGGSNRGYYNVDFCGWIECNQRKFESLDEDSSKSDISEILQKNWCKEFKKAVDKK